MREGGAPFSLRSTALAGRCAARPSSALEMRRTRVSQAGLLEDGFRKLGPRRIAFSGDVPDAERSLQQLTRRRCQMADVGRSGALVVDDCNLVALAREVEHRPDKVRPGRAVEP